MVSSNVVTETLNKAQATPILQATPLASAIFVSQYFDLFSLSLPSLGKNYCTSNCFCNNLAQTRRKLNDNDNHSSHFGLIEEMIC